MQPLKNQRIIANAGSGKTYRLVSRYLELLKREVPAERIIALTFTRKAAGEFLDRIFQRLCDGIGQGDTHSGLSAEECPVHLRQLIEKLPRLALGTLDSFFGRMVRAFPFECGLAGELSIMDSHGLNVARREALDALFRSHDDETAFAAFLDLIRQQSRNTEGRDVAESLGREIAALHEGFLMTPPDRRWGTATTIWPGGATVLDAEDAPPLIEAFERTLFDTHADMTPEYRGHWENLFADLRSLRPNSMVPERALKFALRAIDPPEAKAPDDFYLTVYRTKRFAFPSRDRSLVKALGRSILRVEMEGRLARSRALYDLVDHFEQPYQQLVRDGGRLTFTDITGMLAAAEGATWRGSGSTRSFDRQQMDFRLDATFDHWLLDEFQDTSRLQWQALRNLVDEVVQSDTGRRSFFYVGDTKQAIYTWRGGDPWLFDEIADYYNASGTQSIDTSEALDISRRSVPEILDAVNMLFDPGHLSRLAAGMEFPEQTLERWESAWRTHKPHDPTSGRGCVVWRTVEIGEDTRRAAIDRETAALIREIDPLARGLTCAVLVNTNSQAASVIEALRDAGIAARSEGKFNPCTDNDLGSALISLLRAIAHPLDKLSLNHFKMTALGALASDGLEEFRIRALRQIRAEGFAQAIAGWLNGIDLADNAFARGRVGDFVRAAAAFDAAFCGGSIDDFVFYLQNRISADDPGTGAVRVLTVHASKGLDFDMVVLPVTDDKVLASRRDDMPVHLHSEQDNGVAWGLDLPAKDVCKTDDVLWQAYQKALAEDAYENLCVYYVGATRAKRGLYILSEKMKETSTARSFNRLLHETFPREEGTYVVGNAEWHAEASAKPADSAFTFTPLAGAPHVELRPDSPSLHKAPSHFRAGKLLDKSKARSAGLEAHRLLSQIAWIDREPPHLDSSQPEALRLVEDFLKSETGKSIFTEPSESPTLWRERAFDIVLEGRWISGVFDRVVIHADHAEIFDFKTDEEDASEAHFDQMRLYRQSLAALTGLPGNKISASLVFLKSRKVAAVEN